MTVPSSVAKSGPYICNGVTDVFNYDFRIVDKAHLNVILTDANGAETSLALTTHYTVSDVGSDTGSINLTSAGVALAITGTTLTILRNPPFTQETDLQNQGAYLAQTVEDRFDLLTMQIQTVKERSDRSIAIAASDEDTTLDDLTADLVKVAGIAGDVSTVADNSANVTTVAGISDDVTAVAEIADKIPDAANFVLKTATDASSFGFVAGKGVTPADPSKAVPTVERVEDAVSARIRRFATITAMQASAPLSGEYVFAEGRAAAGDGGGGVYRYNSADLSSTFVRQTLSVSTGEIDTSLNKITKTAHGLRTGQGCLVTGGDGLTADTVVYYIRGRLPDEFTLHPTYMDAVANTNVVDLTGTTAFSVKVLADPDQAAFVTLNGKALDGSEGGLVHSDVKKRNFWRVDWFPTSGPDDTDQINRTVLAAGAGGVVEFPMKTLVVSKRDTEANSLWQLSGQTWRGEDRLRSIVQLSSTETDTTQMIRCIDGSENFRFRTMTFDGNRDNITPTVDLYNHFMLIMGPDGGKHGRWSKLNLINSWGHTLDTGYGTSNLSIDMIVDDVTVLNAGTKAISVAMTKGAVVKNCYVEVNPYTDLENSAGSEAALSGSCYECSHSSDVTISRNTGKQVGPVVAAPGIRITNGSSNVRAQNNNIDNASYLGFIQSVSDIIFTKNTGRNIRGNAIYIDDGDDDQPNDNARRIRVFRNTIIDPDGAYVLVSVNKTVPNAYVEAYIYENSFIRNTGTPTYGIYNGGVVNSGIGGVCEVYQWDNIFGGDAIIPNQLAGPAAIEIQPKPNSGWRIVGQSNVAVAHTGDTTETTLATVTIPAYAMGKNGRARITAQWSYPSSANTKTMRMRWAGSQIYSATATTSAQNRAQVEIGNRNASNSQLVCNYGSTNGWGTSVAAVSTLAVDTTANANVTITGLLANTGETITLESYVVEVLYGL